MNFELYQDSKHEWRWRLLAKNHKIVADSAEGYKRRYSAFVAAEKIVRHLRQNCFVDGYERER